MDSMVAEPTVKVAIVYNPFNAKSIERHDLAYNPDFKLSDYLKGLPEDTNWIVGHNGETYDQPDWDKVEIAPGEGFSLVNIPEGGGGGKSIFRMVALIAVMVAAIAITGGAAAGLFGGALGSLAAGSTSAALAGAFVGIAGSMLVNAIMPAASPTAASSSVDTSPTTYGFDGPKNTSEEGVPVPVVFGTYRVAGNVVDLYTKQDGDDQYLYMRTIVNDGRVKAITDFLINDEDIANFTNVETRIALGDDDGAANDWFGENVRQVQSGAKLTTAFTTHTTTGPVDKLRLSLLFPSGLGTSDGTTGKINPCTVGFEVQYRPAGREDLAWAATSDASIRNYNQFTGYSGGLPGYGAAPIATTQPGFTYKIGSIVNSDGSIVAGASYNTNNNSVADVLNPITNQNEKTVVFSVPSGIDYVTIEALGSLYLTSVDALGGQYGMKVLYRLAGTTVWTEFATDQGTVYRAGSANFPMVTRSYSIPLNSGNWEFAIAGGMPLRVDVSSPASSGPIPIQIQNPGSGNGFDLTGSVTTISTGLAVTRSQLSTVRYEIETDVLDLQAYDVRIRRLDIAADTGSLTTNACYLSDISEIQLDNIQYVGTANVSLKIKMNDQLSQAPKLTALVQGALVKQFDEDGDVVTEDWSPYAPWHVLDILMNEDRGRGLPASRIDFPAFKSWEAYCIDKGLEFNMVFDFDGNVWDAVQIACRAGHAALVRVGTRYSVIVDQPSEPVMIFNDTNIIKGTFQTDWLQLADRANEIQYTFFDKDNAYVQSLLRVTDPLAPNTGAGLRVAQITGQGVTNMAQAQFDVEKQIRENRLLTKTISFESPLEAIGLAQGDVAYVQHTSANYGRGIGGGRLKPGSTVSQLKLDCPVTLDPAKTYSALVIHPAIRRYEVTIVSSATGHVYVQGLPSEVAKVSRLQQGEAETAIYNITEGFPADNILVESTTGFVNGTAYLWSTDVIEEKTVVYQAGPLTTINLTTNLLDIPADYSVWLVGPVETVKKKFRLRTIEGDNILQRKLSFTEYNPDVYLPFGAVITPAAPPVLGPVAQAQNLYFTHPETFIGEYKPVLITFNWTAGDASNYGGSDIYVSLGGAPWTYVRSIQSTTTYEQQFNIGDDFRLRVVEYDLKGIRANINYAPVVGSVVTQTALGLQPPTNLLVDLQDFLVQATVFVAWDASTSSPIDGYLVEYINITEDQYKQFNAGTWAPPDSQLWSIAGLAPGLRETIVQNGIGWLLVRVRTQYGQSVSEWVSRAFYLNAPTVPGRVTGLTLENAVGDPLNGIFTGKDAKFSWRDVAYLASSLEETGADVNGMDYTFKDYEIRIKSPSGQELRRETTVTPYYIYTFEKNVEDSAEIFGTVTGAAHRTFIIEVRLRGRQGQLSDPAWMEVTNPPPDVIHGTLEPDANSVQLAILVPADQDFAGMLVWSDIVPNFTPSADNKVWEGGGKPFWFVNADTTYYVKWAGYDTFGQDEIITSPEVTVEANGLAIGALAQELLDKVNLIDGAFDLPGSVNARIFASEQTQIDANSALATRIDDLATKSNLNNAAVIDEATARSDADGALGDRITAVIASIPAIPDVSAIVSAAVASEATARANADGALATLVSAVTATANGNQSAITTEITARTGADNALGTRIDTVTSTVGGHTTTISSYGTSINGLLGRAGVSIDSNGHVIGWTLNNDGSSGTFIVVADKFGINMPGGGNYSPFYVTGGRVYMDDAFILQLDAGKVTFGTMSGDRIGVNTLNGNRITANSIVTAMLTAGIINAQSLIVDGVVYTGHMQANSITNSSVAHGGAASIANGGAYTTLCSIAITTVGGNILLSFTDYITWNTNGPRGFYRLRREDGTVMTTVGFGGGSCPDALLIAGSGLDTTAGAGSHAYTLEATWTAGNVPVSQGPYLIVTELKR